MAETSTPRSRAVCFCLVHPLVFDELQRLLEGRPYRILTCRLERPLRHGRLRIPRASVYVVDSASRKDVDLLVPEVLSRFPAARILVLVDKPDEAGVFSLLRMGAKGILRYSEVEAHLLRALETVAAGGFWAPRSLLSRFIDDTMRGSRWHTPSRTAPTLSRREKEVMELLLQNRTNKEIAKELNMSERTVKFHVSNLLGKHSAKRRADLILLSLTQRQPA